MKKQSLIKGTLVLGAGGITTRFLGLFFRWPLIMLIGDEGIGYYHMSYPVYMFYVAIASGLPIALSKCISEMLALDQKKSIFVVFKKSFLLMLFLGCGFSTFILLFSRYLISIFNWDNKAYYSMLGIGLAPIVISIMSVFRGYFQGLQNMTPTAVSQLIEQLGRIIAGVGLALLFLPMGIEFAAGGAAFGATAGGIAGSIYLFIKFKEHANEYSTLNLKGGEDLLTKLLSIAVPISLGATVGSVMSLIDSVIVPQQLLRAGFNNQTVAVLYGQLTGKAMVISNIPLTVVAALSAALVPVIAEAKALRNSLQVENKTNLAILIAITIALPASAGIFVMAEPIVNILFPGHGAGYTIVRYSAIAIPFIIGTQVTTAILQATGNYMKPVMTLLLACIVKSIITYKFSMVPSINVFGSVAGTTIGYLISTALNIFFIIRVLKVKINIFNSIMKPVIATSIMIFEVVIVFIKVYNYTISSNISCAISIIIGALTYIILVFIFGIIDYSDFKQKALNNILRRDTND